MNYGIRLGSDTGFANVLAIIDLHTMGSITYVGPTGAAGETYRMSDFLHYNNGANYGYRHDAYLDFGATVNYLYSNGVIQANADAAFTVSISYSQHSAALKNEMISMSDLTTSNDGTTYDPSTFYPCVLLTIGNSSYLHALYKTSGSAPAKLGTGSSE